MKKQLFILFSFLIFIASCKKESTRQISDNMLQSTIKSYLKDSLSTGDFKALDFSSSTVCNYNGGTSIYIIPFVNNQYIQNFVAVKITNAQNIYQAKIIELTANNDERNVAKIKSYNGSISIQSLNRRTVMNSPIVNGYISSWHQTRLEAVQKADIAVVQIVDLPEVVVVAYLPTSGYGISNSEWLNISAILGGGNSGGSSYYQGINYLTSGGGTGGGSSATSTPIQIDFETGNEDPAIDINKYLKCFGTVPDAGATCTIKILTDIPVDSDPFAFFDYKTGSPGHTFLQFNKTNGSQSVQQNIGFYPVLNWKSILATTPQTGKFVDNQSHEFNASLSMNISPGNFSQVLTHVQYLSQFVRYDLDEYNCTDFALDIFNYKRPGRPLEIPKFDISAGLAPDGSSTPQGLYQKLQSMKKLGDAESNNITIPGVKGFAGNSDGPCN